jgi:cytidyltransferase-like protein
MVDGLIVMRAQPLHYGHIRLIEEALKECRSVFIVLGSVQEFGTSRNPFTYSERKKMIKNYFKDNPLWERINIIGLKDIFSLEWPNYVISSVLDRYPDADLTEVYGGSKYDCDWFKDHTLISHILDRADNNYPYVSASMIRDMLMYKDVRWMNYVPKCNHQIVAKKFNRLDMLPEETLELEEFLFDEVLPDIPMMSLLASDSSIMHKSGIIKAVKAKRNL